MVTAPRRIFAYFLTILGLDQFSYATNQYNSQIKTASSGVFSTASFMTDSTLFVTTDEGKHNDRMANDAWTLQTWLGGLPKMALCQILTTTALKYPKVLQSIEDHQTILNLPSWPLTTSGPPTHTMHDELLDIKQRVHRAVHRLDGLRPCEQFAHEAEVANELHRIVRLCTNMLHASPHGFSLVALIGLLVVAQESLGAVQEVRRHLFGPAKLGRGIVLEMASVLKNYKHPLSPLRPSQRSMLLAELDLPAPSQPNSHTDRLIQSLDSVCQAMADYDPTWDYRQEYHNVVQIAARYCL